MAEVGEGGETREEGGAYRAGRGEGGAGRGQGSCARGEGLVRGGEREFGGGMTSGAHNGRWRRLNRRALHARGEQGGELGPRLGRAGGAGPPSQLAQEGRGGRLGRAKKPAQERRGGSFLFSISYLAIIFY
jgi:hypothetical protein